MSRSNPLAELFPSYYFVFSVNKTEKVQWRRRGAEDAGAKENMHGLGSAPTLAETAVFV